MLSFELGYYMATFLAIYVLLFIDYSIKCAKLRKIKKFMVKYNLSNQYERYLFEQKQEYKSAWKRIFKGE